jgi:glycosyltransferase involved in cell wall biosynthesis
LEPAVKILIAIASLSPRHGGPSKAAVEMAQALQARGHRVDIFTTDQDGHGRLDVPTDRPVIQDGVPVHYFRARVMGGWPSVSYGFWRAVRNRITEYDIVHSHSLWLFPGMIVGHYCRKHGVPYLIRPCGAMDPVIFRRHRYRKALLETAFERRNFRGAAAVHFTTQEEMEVAEPARRELPFEKGVVVPLGVRREDYSKLPPVGTFRRYYPEIGQRRILLFLSRINFKKGLDLLIPAFGTIARRRNDVHLVLAGPEEDGLGKDVRLWIEREGVQERVTLTGMLHGEMKFAALREAEALVLPSYSENFGIAVVEAMACKLPVIISDKVNIRREVDGAKAGLVTTCDSAAIALAIDALLSDPQKGREMGENGYRLVDEQYSWSRAAELLETTYLSLLAESGATAVGTKNVARKSVVRAN